MKHVCILAIEHGLASSMTIPLEMMGAADIIQRLRSPQARTLQLTIASHDGQALRMTGGIEIHPAEAVTSLPRCDLIFVPALWGNPNAIVRRYPVITRWLASQYAAGATLCAVGTGSYFLAHAGVLDGKSATTHWYYFDNFQQRYPLVKLERKRFITHADRLYCTGSVNAVRDVTMHLVEALLGAEIADEVARHFTHELKRSYESLLLASEQKNTHHDELIIKIQEWLQGHYQEAISLQALAARFELGVRSFNRRFRNAVKQSPLQYLQEVRLEQAKSLLKLSNLTIAEIAFAVGYQDASHFTSLFKRMNAVTPNEYRRLVRTKLFNVEVESGDVPAGTL